jgi:hypothetical protein
MNNRQAALIAASSLTTTVTAATRQARLLTVWLDELDAAETEKRLPTDFNIVARAVEASSKLEQAQDSPVVRFHFDGDRPTVDLASDQSYEWYGSWSRIR